jgi:predicted N-acetyltransferase YhbS
MQLPIIRPMTTGDVDEVAAALLRENWGDRRLHLEFVAGHPQAFPFVAEADGEVVGTGIATLNGPVAWIGTIWVHPDWRRRGLGMAMTQAAVDAAESRGCRTLLLVATAAGRPLYERIGFEVHTWYRMFEGEGLGDVPIDPRIRPYAPVDLEAMGRLATAASGEERTHLLAAFASPGTAHCLVRDDGTLGGFVVRAPWGGGSTIAPRLDDAGALLHSRRVGRGPDHVIRAGLIAENEAGAEHLLAAGWTETWQAPRLLRGEPLDWEPTAIWGQFNHAMG